MMADEIQSYKDMVPCTLTDGTKLWDILKQTDLMTDGELHIQLKRDGMHILQMDPAQIALATYKIPKEWFDSYNVINNKGRQTRVEGNPVNDEIIISLDTPAFLKVFSKKILAWGPLSLMFEGTDTGNLRLKGEVDGDIKVLQHMKLDEYTRTMPKTPDIDFTSRFEVEMKDLIEWLELIYEINQHVTVTQTHSNLVFQTEDDLNKLRFDVTKKTPLKQMMPDKQGEIPGKSKAIFSVEYFLKMLPRKNKKLQDTKVTCFLKTDAPLQLSYKIHDVEMKFFLAPRIESGTD